MKNARWLLAGFALALALPNLHAAEKVATHPAMRPLPKSAGIPRAEGPARFVDASRGDDASMGTEEAPWKTLKHSLRKLKPGETLYLRGTFYEKVGLTRSGTEEAPITIRSVPGELAVIDGGQSKFLTDPAASWQPLKGGASGEFVSTRTYPDADRRIVPGQFLPGSWEPLWGKQDERPLVLGHFADSMVPLHSYRHLADLRSRNEHWIGNKFAMRETGIYCGPGVWFNHETARVHIRLAHHQLKGLGDRTYRGETDPRKLPLSISVGFGVDVLTVFPEDDHVN